MDQAVIKILLVEDSPADARLVCDMLTNAGRNGDGATFYVTHVSRLEEALAVLTEGTFDLVLLDLSLPDNHGLATLQQMLGAVPGLPVVVMSSLRDPQSAQAAIRAGAQDCLVKGQVDEYSLPHAIHCAIERKRANEHLRQDVAQLVALREGGVELAAQLDLDTVLRSIVERAVGLVGGVSGGLDLYRPDLDALEWAVVVGSNPRWPGTLLQRGEGLNGKVWQTGRPLIVDNCQYWDGQAAIYEGHPFTSMVSVPIFLRDEFLGVLGVLGEVPDAFSQADAELLSLFADQAASVIYNARLLQAERTTRQHLEMLYRIGQTLISTLDVDTILNRLTDEALRATGATHGSVLVANRQSGSFERRSLQGYTPEQKRKACIQHLPLDHGLNGRAYRSRQVVCVGDVRAEPDYFPLVPETRAELVVPIMVGEEVVGNLDLQSPEVDAFSQGKVNLWFLAVLTDQVALALENARLFQAERAAREQAEKLQAATQALSATLDLQQVFEGILRELQSVLPYDSASVQQLQGERLEIIGGHGFPDLDALLGEGFELADSDNPNREVVRTRAPLILDDAAAAYAGFRREPHAQARIRSWLGVPLLFGDRLLGMIALDKRESGFYTQEHARLAMAFAAQAAIAIENARLYQEAQQRLRELALLFETSATLSATMDLDTVLHTMAQRITTALAAEGCAISVIEPEEATVVTLLDYSPDPDAWQPTPPGTSYPLANYPATRQVLVERRPLTVLASDPRADPAEVAWMAAAGVRALLMVPLAVGDKVIGLLELMETGQERAYAPAEITLCQTLANQGAAVLENARLYEEARRRNKELALLNRVIAASAASQDVQQILETACTELALAFGLPQAAAALFDEDKTEAVTVAEYLAEGRPTAMGAIIPAVGTPSSQYLLQHNAPLVVDDAQTDLRLAPIHGLMRQRGTVSLLLLPLVVEGEVVGTLELDAVEPRRFSSVEVDLAQRVAQQVSGALGRARLVAAQRRLSTAVEQSAESIAVTATDGTVLYVNPALERVSGYSRAEVLGQTLQILGSGKQDSAFYEQVQRTIAAGQVWQGRHVSRRKDGSLYTEEATIAPVRNQAGEIVNYVATMRDISREMELEEQFRQAQKMEAVGRLAGGVAHDFNNLLTIIHLSARLLERKLSAEDPLWQHVQRIRETGERATKLTGQLLAFSRQGVMEPKVIDLNHMAAEVTEMLFRLIGEDIELVTHLSDGLWPVYADPIQIEQILFNLAVNARDAMPQGGTLSISTANLALDRAYADRQLDVQPGEYVMLAVSDTGVGMDDQVRAHLFEPFFTTKERGKGTGLGLATVFGIVRQHGGHIQVCSEPGHGATFRIYLPRTEDVEARPPEPAQAPLPSGPTPARETLLLIEDEADVRVLAAQILDSQGYRILAAANGSEAIRLSEEYDGPIHLVLTDVVMPQMSGPEVAEQLSAQRPEMRVLYMSGYADEAAVQHVRPTKQIPFLPKPFSVEQLLLKVRAVLDGQTQTERR